MAREYCQTCHYPTSVCFCDLITEIRSPVQFDILQHPSEAKEFKNTAKLLALCHQNTTIWQGECSEDFTELREKLADCDSRRTYLLYPSDHAVDLGELAVNTDYNEHNIRFLLIDGTWKKAFKIMQLNHWLADFPHAKITGKSSEYKIRKYAGNREALSTLEAAQVCFNNFSPHINTDTLQNCFNKLRSIYLQRAGKNYN